MAQIASEVLVERLIDWGVDTVFGLPGDGINGIMEGLRRHQDRLKFVLVHHEEAAAFMASGAREGDGKARRLPGDLGPGGIHLLNGLYDAKLDHVPVLAITGMQETSLLGTGYQQEVALDKLYADVAEYDMMISNPVQIPAVVDLAIRTAYARRGVAHITVPNDIQVADAGADPWQHVAPASTPKTSASLPAAARPARRRRTCSGSRTSSTRERRSASWPARGHCTPVRSCSRSPRPSTRRSSRRCPARPPFPTTHPYTTGGIGLLGTKPSEDLMDEIDTLLMVGTNFPYTKHLPQGVQVRADRGRPGQGRRPASPPTCRSWAIRRRPCARCCPCSSSGRTHEFLAQVQRESEVAARAWTALEGTERDPIAARST